MVECALVPGDADIENRAVEVDTGPRARRFGWESLGLPLILLAALALRLSNLDWDGGHLFHPDERYILMTTDALRLPWPPNLDVLLSPDSPLNPKGFAYGSLVFYMLKLSHWIAQTIGGRLGLGGDW